MPTPANAPAIANWLRQRFNVRGRLGLAVDEMVAPVAVVASTPEAEAGRAWGWKNTAAVVGEFGWVRIRPQVVAAGPGLAGYDQTIAIHVTRARFRKAGAGTVYIRINSGGPGGFTVGSKAWRACFQPGSPSAILDGGTNVGTPGTLISRVQVPGANESAEVDLDVWISGNVENSDWVTSSLNFQNATVNESWDVSLEWEEMPIAQAPLYTGAP